MMKREERTARRTGVLVLMGLLVLTASSVSWGAITALAHYDGNTGNGGKDLDMSANPQFKFWTTLGGGSHTVNPTGGQANFGGALSSVPQAGSIYTFFDSSPYSTIFGASGTVETWISPNWNGASQGGSGVGGPGSSQLLFSNQYNLWGSDTKGLQVFLFNNGWPNDGGQLFAWWADSGGTVTLNNSPTQPSGDPQQGTTANWVAGQWHHVAFTWTPSQIRLFLDGQIVATGAPKGPQPFQGTMWVGGLNGSSGFDGKLDELVIWNEVRYTGAFTPPTHPVPEPMSLILLGLGVSALGRRKRTD